MREIVFRGNQVNDGMWIQGYLFQCWGRAYILWGMTNDTPTMHEVKPETVGQFTGLTDKNGKRVFEGDIMLLGDGTKRKTVIEYDSLRAQFVARLFDKNSIRMAVSFWSAGEIIGNIHDNKMEDIK